MFVTREEIIEARKKATSILTEVKKAYDLDKEDVYYYIVNDEGKFFVDRDTQNCWGIIFHKTSEFYPKIYLTYSHKLFDNMYGENMIEDRMGMGSFDSRVDTDNDILNAITIMCLIGNPVHEKDLEDDAFSLEKFKCAFLEDKEIFCSLKDYVEFNNIETEPYIHKSGVEHIEIKAPIRESIKVFDDDSVYFKIQRLTPYDENIAGIGQWSYAFDNMERYKEHDKNMGRLVVNKHDYEIGKILFQLDLN